VVTWEDILSRWQHVECDLRSEYGLALDGRASLRALSWRSLRTLIIGLCHADTRLARALAPSDTPAR